jgi:hypothetical protein
MPSKIQGKNEAVALATTIVAGIEKHLASGQTMAFAGGIFTAAQITTELDQVVALRTAVTTAQAAAKAKVEAETAQLPALRAFMSALVQCIKVAYGTQTDVLADFGIAPKKVPAPLTIEQKAAAAAKREATRVARGTKSAKAKKGIKGAVTGVVVTPIVAGAPVVQAPVASGVVPSTGTATGGTAQKTT